MITILDITLPKRVEGSYAWRIQIETYAPAYDGFIMRVSRDGTESARIPFESFQAIPLAGVFGWLADMVRVHGSKT